MIIDSHCHLNMKDFENDLDNIINNAKNNNIEGMLSISTKCDEFENIKLISNNYKNVWYSLGIHPHNVDTNYNKINSYIPNFLSDTNFVGIGETGLDYFYDNSDRELQKESFINHINIARENKLPIIIHTRDAEDDTIKILKNETNKGSFRGLIHCFTASQELANEVLSMGFYISISGIVTFKNAEKLRSTVKSIPLNKLLIETDAPYLAPVPMRGKRNEPAFVAHTANYLAKLLKLSNNELNEITTKNFFNLFSKAELTK
jgi:TatD DNase family protein